MNEIIKEAIKNLIDGMDYINENHNEEFGEECPYLPDEDSAKLLQDLQKAIKEDDNK